MTDNNVVYIRGLGFKCRSGSRREQVLLALEKQDETRPGDRWWIAITLALVAGFGFGILAAWWGLV